MKIWWFLMLTTLLANGLLCENENNRRSKPRRTRTHAITDVKNSHRVLPSTVISTVTERATSLKFGDTLKTKVKQDYQQQPFLIKDKRIQRTYSEPSVQSTTPKTTVSVKSSPRTLSRSQVISVNPDTGKPKELTRDSSKQTLRLFLHETPPQKSKTNDSSKVHKVILSKSETTSRRVPKSTSTQPPPALIPTSSPCPYVRLTTPRLTVTSASRTLISSPVDYSHQKQGSKHSEWIVIQGDTATAATAPKTAAEYVPLRVTTKSPNVQISQSQYVTSTTPKPTNYAPPPELCPCLTASTPQQGTTRGYFTITQAPQINLPVTSQIKVPVTHAPQINIPVTQVPQIKVPVTHAPHLTIPVTLAPQIKIPVTHAPQIRTPVTFAPQIRIPVTHAPQIIVPVTQAPQIRIPVTHAPQIRIPVTHAPQIRVPVTQAPQIRIPVHVTQAPQIRIPVHVTQAPQINIQTASPTKIYAPTTPSSNIYVSKTPSQQVYISTTQSPNIYVSTTHVPQTHAPSTKPPVRTKTLVKDTFDTLSTQQVPATRHRRPIARPTTQTSIFDEQIPVRSGHKSIESPHHWIGDPAYQIYSQYHDIKREQPSQTTRKPPGGSKTTSIVLNQYQTTTRQPTYKHQEVIYVTKQPYPTTYRPTQTYSQSAHSTTVKPQQVRVTVPYYSTQTPPVLRVTHSSTTASPMPQKPRPLSVVSQHATLPEYSSVTTVKTPPQQKDWSDDSYIQAVHNFHFESFKDNKQTVSSKPKPAFVPVQYAPVKTHIPVAISTPQIVSSTITPIIQVQPMQVQIQYPKKEIQIEQKKPAAEQFHFEIDIRQQKTAVKAVQEVLQQTFSSSTPSPPLTVTPHPNYSTKRTNIIVPNVQILVPQYQPARIPTIVNIPPPPPTRPPPPPPTRPPPPPPTRPPPPPPTRPPPPPPTRPQQQIIGLHQYHNYESNKIQQYPNQIIPVLISQPNPSTTVKPIVSVPVKQTVFIQQPIYLSSPRPTIYIPSVSYAPTQAPPPIQKENTKSDSSEESNEQYQYNIEVTRQEHVKSVSAVLPQVYVQQPLQTVHIPKPLLPKPQPNTNIIIPVSPMHVHVTTPRTATLPCPVDHVNKNVSPVQQLLPIINVTPLPPQTTKHVLIHHKLPSTKEQRPITEAPRIHSTITAVLSQNEYAKPIQQVAVNLGTSETKPPQPLPSPNANNVPIPQWPPIPNSEWRGDSVSHVVHQSHIYPVIRWPASPGAPPAEPPPGFATNKGHTNVFTQYSVNHQHRVNSQTSNKVTENKAKQKHAEDSDTIQENLVPPTPTIVFFPSAPVAPQNYNPGQQAYNPHLVAAASINQVFNHVPYEPQAQGSYHIPRVVRYTEGKPETDSNEEEVEVEDDEDDTFY